VDRTIGCINAKPGSVAVSRQAGETTGELAMRESIDSERICRLVLRFVFGEQRYQCTARRLNFLCPTWPMQAFERLRLRNGSVWVGDGAPCILYAWTLSGMGLDPFPSNTDGKWDRDGTNPILDRVRGTDSRPWYIVGDWASPIPVPYCPSVLDADGSWSKGCQ
jgi:hypothetical protein